MIGIDEIKRRIKLCISSMEAHKAYKVKALNDNNTVFNVNQEEMITWHQRIGRDYKEWGVGGSNTRTIMHYANQIWEQLHDK